MVLIIVPSLSPVSVVSPSLAVTWYVLSASSKYGHTLVASPKQIGSIPVANGSRLPV